MPEKETKTDQEDQNFFSEILNYYMQKFDITQADIARKLGVSTSMVSYWCNAAKMPRPSNIKKLAALFGVSYTDMLAPSAEVDFADLEQPESGIVSEIDSLQRKIERAPKPLIYGGKEISDEETEVLAAVIKLIRTNKSDRRKPSE